MLWKCPFIVIMPEKALGFQPGHDPRIVKLKQFYLLIRLQWMMQRLRLFISVLQFHVSRLAVCFVVVDKVSSFWILPAKIVLTNRILITSDCFVVHPPSHSTFKALVSFFVIMSPMDMRFCPCNQHFLRIQMDQGNSSPAPARLPPTF